jgi:hypothetical protein
VYSVFQQADMLSRHAIMHVPSEARAGGVVRAFDSNGATYSIQLPPVSGLSFVAVCLPPEPPHTPAPDDAQELVQSTINSLVSAGQLRSSEGLSVPPCDFPPFSPVTMNIKSTCMMLTKLCGDGSSPVSDFQHYLSLLKALLMQAKHQYDEQNKITRASWHPGKAKLPPSTDCRVLTH